MPQEKYTVRSVLNDPAPLPDRKGKSARTPLEQAKKWASDYLKRPHSEKELRRKLREKGVSEADIETVCALCIDYGFLNDSEYAGSIVRHYTAMGYGAGRVRQELYRRGVPEELWDEAMQQLPESGGTIDRLLARRLSGRDITDRKELDRAANTLYRRGFSWEEIRAAIGRLGTYDDEHEV